MWNDENYFDSYAYVFDGSEYNFFTDVHRPKRKIKADFAEDSGHYKQQDFSLELLQRGLYLTNTEDISSQRDGEIYKSDVSVYVGVCAGLKALIKGAVDNNNSFEYIHVDISPAALDYRMFADNLLKDNYLSNLDDIWNSYQSMDITRPLPLFGGGYNSIEDALTDYLEQVEIDRRQWYDFLENYVNSKKIYVKIDLINNVKLLSRLLPKEKRIWMWYSNAFDWHQFRHTEVTFNRWKTYLEKRHEIDLCGHTPPFTSEKR